MHGFAYFLKFIPVPLSVLMELFVFDLYENSVGEVTLEPRNCTTGIRKENENPLSNLCRLITP